MSKILKLINVYKSYKNEKYVLKNINLSINEGEIIVITGLSGCGKTTLLNILGLIDTPTLGEYFIENINICNLNKKEIACILNTKIGFIFQSYYLISGLSVRENILLPLIYRRQRLLNIAEIDNKLNEITKLLNIETLINKKVELLSGGEKQRIAVARILMANSDIILADEPTGNLDNFHRDLIKKYFKMISSKFKKTIIIVTHDLNLKELADRCFYIKDGELIEE